MKKHSVPVVRFTKVVLLLAYAGCGGGDPIGPTEPLVATTLGANSSTSISGFAGSVVTPAPSVIVRDQNGSPLGGAPVTFAVASGGGSVSGATATSDASGIATVGSWTLGPVAGTNILTAVSGSLTGVTFTAISAAGTAATIAKNSGDNQTAIAGSAVPVLPSVLVKDANGNPAGGVSVTFAVASGGGSVTGATAATNGAGVATVGSWTLGNTVGANSLTATVAGLPPVIFAATSTVGAAASVAKNAGDNQTAFAGSSVAIAPSVLVRDSNGNPTSGITVTFAVASGGGSITGATAVTNAAGVATVGSWTLGTTAGANSLTATAAGLPPATFNATAAVGTAASITKNAGDNQSASAGTSVLVPPSVVVRDANGNPTGGVSVTFAVTSGGGSVTGATSVTNGAGIAAVGNWSLGNAVGTNTLIATVGNLAPVTFTATATFNICAASVAHTFGSSTSGSLASTDCRLSDGSFVDFYTTSVPQAGVYLFRQGAGFDAYLLLAMPDGTTIGENDDEIETGTNSGIKAILPAGSYLLGPGSLEPGVTGDYEISSTTAASDISNCESVFVVRNISTSQTISSADCNSGSGAAPLLSDGYFIFLEAGMTVTINMTSGPLDSYLMLTRLGGQVVSENDNVNSGTRDARITYTAAETNYYAIFARSAASSASAVGAYTLSIQ